MIGFLTAGFVVGVVMLGVGRKHGGRLAGAGVALVLLSTLLAVVEIASPSPAERLRRTPIDDLLAVIETGEDTSLVVAEVERRRRDDELSDAEDTRVISAVLRRHRDAGRAWDPVLRSLVVNSDGIDADQLQRYANQIFPLAPETKVSVRQGDPIPVLLRHNRRRDRASRSRNDEHWPLEPYGVLVLRDIEINGRPASVVECGELIERRGDTTMVAFLNRYGDRTPPTMLLSPPEGLIGNAVVRFRYAVVFVDERGRLRRSGEFDDASPSAGSISIWSEASLSTRIRAPAAPRSGAPVPSSVTSKSLELSLLELNGSNACYELRGTIEHGDAEIAHGLYLQFEDRDELLVGRLTSSEPLYPWYRDPLDGPQQDANGPWGIWARSEAPGERRIREQVNLDREIAGAVRILLRPDPVLGTCAVGIGDPPSVEVDLGVAPVSDSPLHREDIEAARRAIGANQRREEGP